jgi:lactoylglutathione lyase
MSEFLHVSLRSRDRDRTSEWYQKNLGFEESRRGTTGIGTQTAILVLPGNQTYIEVSDRVRLGSDFEIPAEAIVLQFTVADLAAAARRLQENGATALAGGADRGYILVEDADGYQVELTQGEPGKFASFGIRVSDLDASSRFYRDNLGFREVGRGTNARGEETATLELPGNNTTVTLRRSPTLPADISIPENLMHMAFPVSDMKQWTKEMTDRGVSVEPDGERMAWIVDPNGYEMEMIERR